MPRKKETPESDLLIDLPCVCATTRRTARALTQLYDASLRASQLEGAQYSLLLLIEAKTGCTQAEIGRMMILDKTTLSRNLQLLKRKKWIATQASDDARERRLSLTAEGKKILEVAKPLWAAAQKKLRAQLTSEEWETIWKTLRILTDATRRSQSN
ncbi:MAG TPA: MarR family winged helix-turn-helix transcriptional regulator [Opitutaceae bacterium]|nr:MarR family winged helix-turn-helix transcriptional regulator [Opitutaceae bacterium]